MIDYSAREQRLDWDLVETHLEAILEAAGKSEKGKPCFGQEHAARGLMRRIKTGGAVLADEVGLGKTRVALMLMEAVTRGGGTVAAVVPPGLLYQWENEHRDFLASLEEGGAVSEKPRRVIKLRSYWNLFSCYEPGPSDNGVTYPLVAPGRGHWLLISHNFGFLNRVSGRTNPRDFELPVLVRALRDNAAGVHGNSLWLKYLRWFERRHGDYRRLSGREREQRRNGAVLDAATFLVSGFEGFSDRTQAFLQDGIECPRDRRGKRVGNAATLFASGEVGRGPVHELIGELLGPIDLLVVDEAHKSREGQPDGADSVGAATKRLTALVEQILRPRNEGSRRLCLTATPVELGVHQWEDLLSRARVWLTDEARTVLSEFETRLASANLTPDQPEVLEDLCQAAKSFQAELAPFVVRRRRLNQPEHKDLLPAGMEGGAHPHRALGSVDIEASTLSPEWRRAVLALEAMSLTAGGTRTDNADKLTTYRYAAAMLDLDDEDHEKPAASADEAATAEGARLRRVSCWRRMALHHASAGCGDTRDYASHPRVLATADFIERTLARCAQEKILVFGRFTKPMQLLARELNGRYVLRQLTRGNPTLAMRVDEADLWSCAERLLRRSDDLGLAFDAGAPTWSRQSDLVAHVELAKTQYRNLQRRLARWFDKDWMLSNLPGDACLRQMQDDDQREGKRGDRLDVVLTQLRSDLLDEILASDQRGVLAPSTTQSRSHGGDEAVEDDAPLDGGARRELGRKLIEIWSNYVRGAFDPNVAEDDPEGTGWEGDREFEEVDAQGDRMSPDHLFAAMGLSADGDTLASFQRGEFCRLMDGGMAMSTRRIVQERFNRPGAFPTVLVAQSLVGREGLNLHRACRRVVLFHPEWNPAVVEQEIGRVDRIQSLWNQKAQEWRQRQDGAEFPKIHVDFVVFRGTYDEYQFQVLEGRRRSLEAQLFGALLDEEALAKVPAEYRLRLAAVAPDFEPSAVPRE